MLLPVPLQVSGPFLAYPSAHKSGFLDFRVHGHFSNQVNVVGHEAISDERRTSFCVTCDLGLDNDRDEAPRRRSMRHAGNDRRFPFEDGMVQN